MLMNACQIMEDVMLMQIVLILKEVLVVLAKQVIQEMVLIVMVRKSLVFLINSTKNIYLF